MRSITVAMMFSSLLVTSAMNAQPDKLLDLQLSAELKPNRALALQVVVRNATSTPLSISITPQDPPFRTSIFDANGNDLYQFTYANDIKNGKSLVRKEGPHLATLNLGPGQSKTYDATIDKVFVEEKPVTLPDGTYRVQVRLGRVAYQNGQYETTLYHSNTVEILVRQR